MIISPPDDRSHYTWIFFVCLIFGLVSSFFLLPDVECEIIKNHMLLTHRGKPENPSRVLGRY